MPVTPSSSVATSSTAAPSQTAPGSTILTFPSLIQPDAFVYHVNLFIFSVIALLVVFRLPRAAARFHSWSEASSGIFLRKVRTIPNRQLQRNGSSASAFSTKSTATGLASDNSHSFYSSPSAIPRRRRYGQYPPHLPSCPRLFLPLFLPLRKRIAEGVVVSQMMIQLIWLAIMIFASFFSTPGPLLEPTRMSWLAVSQLPLVYTFSAKNNVFSMLWGAGYEKINFMHRFIGRAVIVAINIHSIDYIYKWILTGVFRTHIVKPTYYWGLIGLVAADCILVFSTQFWRRKAYTIFLTTHTVGYVMVIPALWFHCPTAKPYIFACLGVITLDRVLRVLKTRVTTATIRAIPELGTTRIECRDINSGWRAGQHVRLRVLSAGLGPFGWLAVHPFSISSLSARSGGNEGEGLVLLSKKTATAGSWTNRLYALARGPYGRSSDATPSEKGMEDQTVMVAVEGPYGGPGHTMLSSYSAVVLVVAGSGISYGLSVVKDLIEKDLLNQSRVKVIELVWIVQDPAALLPFIPVLTSLIRQSSPAGDSSYTSFKVSVFYTRAPIGQFPFQEDYFRRWFPKLTLSPGRPKVERILEGVLGKIVRLGAGVKDNEPNMGVAVAVCGPMELADQVSADVWALDEGRREKVGGVDLIEETFGW